MDARSTDPERSALLGELRRRAATAAVLCDVDGTLAPIVARPEEAAIAPRAREALQALSRHYALVACVSGRQALEARRIVGLEELRYIGNHGYELLDPGASQPHPNPALAANDGGDGAVARFTSGVDLGALRELGIGVEDKGPIQGFHWRASSDPKEAESSLALLAEQATAAGLFAHWGRMILELRPGAAVDKGTAIEDMLEEGVEAALYVGDDRTDLDAFDALRRMHDSGRLRAAVCVGVVSDDGPAEIAERSDVTVEGVDGVAGLLQELGEI